LEETNLKSGDSVVVIGLGPIGLMFVRLAHVCGARVIAIGRRQTQLDRAARMGADELILGDGSVDLERAVKGMTESRGSDVVIEAVGLPEAWETAITLVRRGGIVNFFGGCPNDSRIALDTSLLHYSEISCKASFHHTPAHIRKALESVSRGEITSQDFVNGVEPLSNLLEVMRHLMSHNGHMKTAIVP
jgi:L-iditol 2-dehydrogenase